MGESLEIQSLVAVFAFPLVTFGVTIVYEVFFFVSGPRIGVSPPDKLHSSTPVQDLELYFQKKRDRVGGCQRGSSMRF
jgi:hypothetical protein